MLQIPFIHNFSLPIMIKHKTHYSSKSEQKVGRGVYGTCIHHLSKCNSTAIFWFWRAHLCWQSHRPEWDVQGQRWRRLEATESQNGSVASEMTALRLTPQVLATWWPSPILSLCSCKNKCLPPINKLLMISNLVQRCFKRKSQFGNSLKFNSQMHLRSISGGQPHFNLFYVIKRGC